MSGDLVIEIRSSESAVGDLVQALTEDGLAPEVRKPRPPTALPGPGAFEVIRFAVEVLVVAIHSQEIAAAVARRVKEFTAKHKTTTEIRDLATGERVMRVDPSTPVEAVTDSISIRTEDPPET